MLVGVLLSLGAVNALIPLAIILLLIVAAAGATRGYSIFNIFGIAALSGIGLGAGGMKGKTAMGRFFLFRTISGQPGRLKKMPNKGTKKSLSLIPAIANIHRFGNRFFKKGSDFDVAYRNVKKNKEPLTEKGINEDKAKKSAKELAGKETKRKNLKAYNASLGGKRVRMSVRFPFVKAYKPLHAAPKLSRAEKDARHPTRADLREKGREAFAKTLAIVSPPIYILTALIPKTRGILYNTGSSEPTPFIFRGRDPSKWQRNTTRVEDLTKKAMGLKGTLTAIQAEHDAKWLLRDNLSTSRAERRRLDREIQRLEQGNLIHKGDPALRDTAEYRDAEQRQRLPPAIVRIDSAIEIFQNVSRATYRRAREYADAVDTHTERLQTIASDASVTDKRGATIKENQRFARESKRILREFRERNSQFEDKTNFNFFWSKTTRNPVAADLNLISDTIGSAGFKTWNAWPFAKPEEQTFHGVKLPTIDLGFDPHENEPAKKMAEALYERYLRQAERKVRMQTTPGRSSR